jgi:hypothetical protein
MTEFPGREVYNEDEDDSLGNIIITEEKIFKLWEQVIFIYKGQGQINIKPQIQEVLEEKAEFWLLSTHVLT